MRILLTGATGALGAVVATELAAAAELTCLTRRRRPSLAGVQEVRGDLAAPHLGLDARAYAHLTDQTDVVVHCGAMTSFTDDGHRAQSVNVDGTQRVLDLVVAAGARLVHVSTAFVARTEEFVGPQRGGLRSPVSYLRSKVQAESMVLGSGLDPVVVRPSIVIGDSLTGRIDQFQGWHTMCEAIMTGRTPFLPADGSALVDCVPVDFVARAIARLALDPAAGGTWWLTAGNDALTLAESIELCLDEATDRGLDTPRPRTLRREMVERLVLPAFCEDVPAPLRRQLVAGIELIRLFGSEHRFPSHWPTGQLAPPPSRAELVRCFRQSLRHLCEQRDIGAQARVA